jgi:hypothetical protein
MSVLAPVDGSITVTVHVPNRAAVLQPILTVLLLIVPTGLGSGSRQNSHECARDLCAAYWKRSPARLRPSRFMEKLIPLPSFLMGNQSGDLNIFEDVGCGAAQYKTA